MISLDDWVSAGRGTNGSPLELYLNAISPGHACRVELYDGKQISANVQRYAVRKIAPNHYRGVVLLISATAATAEVRCVESDRDDVRAWLTSEGVPCIRISPPK